MKRASFRIARFDPGARPRGHRLLGARRVRGQDTASPRPSPGSRRPEIAGAEIWYKATAGNDALQHLRLPAAHRRADRLVPRAARRPARRALQGLGHHQRPRLLHARRSRTARRRAWRRRTASSGARATTMLLEVRRQGRLPRPGLRLQGCPLDPRRRKAATTSGRPRATWSSAPRPARSASASSPIRASTPRSGSKINGGRSAPGTGYRKRALRRPGDPSDCARQPARRSARSSRRS